MPIDPGTLALVQYTEDEINSWHLATRGVRDGSHPTETFGPDGTTCERSWFCDWDDRYDVKDWFVGKVVRYDDAGTLKLSRLMPQTHPVFTNWIATKVTSITGHQIIGDDDDGMPEYTLAEIKVLYEMAPFLLLEDSIGAETARYVTYAGGPGNEIQSSAEYLSMPGGVLNYLVEGGATTAPFAPPHMTPIPYGFGFPVVKEMFSVTWKRLPYVAFLPNSNLYTRVYGDPSVPTRPYIGAINSTTLFDRKVGTCQLVGVEPRLLPDPDGLGWMWDLKYLFSHSPEGQHAFYFFDSRRDSAGEPVTPSLSGWYQVGRGPQWYASGDPAADGKTLFVARDLEADLFDLNP